MPYLIDAIEALAILLKVDKTVEAMARVFVKINGELPQKQTLIETVRKDIYKNEKGWPIIIFNDQTEQICKLLVGFLRVSSVKKVEKS